jgi:hypothetical protein
MHINSHFAVGLIFVSILYNFYHFNPLEFSLILIASFICDFDIFFSKFASDHNHRMLFSHSVLPSVVIILVGIISGWYVLTFIGTSYCIHVIIDTFDWGTNFFYFNKRSIGLKLLISKTELENLNTYVSQYKYKESFFDAKYYNNKINLLIETLLFIMMIVSVMFFAIEYAWVCLFYFIGLYFHISRHFFLKRMEARV